MPNCRDESDEDAEGCRLLVLKENYRKDVVIIIVVIILIIPIIVAIILIMTII